MHLHLLHFTTRERLSDSLLRNRIFRLYSSSLAASSLEFEGGMFSGEDKYFPSKVLSRLD